SSADFPARPRAVARALEGGSGAADRSVGLRARAPIAGRAAGAAPGGRAFAPARAGARPGSRPTRGGERRPAGIARPPPRSRSRAVRDAARAERGATRPDSTMNAPDPEPRSVLIGTSGYSFADWIGPFYPPGTRAGDFLAW